MLVGYREWVNDVERLCESCQWGPLTVLQSGGPHWQQSCNLSTVLTHSLNPIMYCFSLHQIFKGEQHHSLRFSSHSRATQKPGMSLIIVTYRTPLTRRHKYGNHLFSIYLVNPQVFERFIFHQKSSLSNLNKNSHAFYIPYELMNNISVHISPKKVIFRAV